MDEQIRTELKKYYDGDVARRWTASLSGWKKRERQHFFELCRRESLQDFLEIGAGTGRDSIFFQQQGFSVTAIDLSNSMIDHCCELGLTAYVMDMAALTFEANSFDAVYALNSLLHVPDAELDDVLAEVCRVLRPNGLFYYGTYGGRRFEGPMQPQGTTSPRFFNYYTNEQLRDRVASLFEQVYFQAIGVERGVDYHFQSMICRKA